MSLPSLLLRLVRWKTELGDADPLLAQDL